MGINFTLYKFDFQTSIDLISSEPGADQLPLDTKHLHLQSENIPNYRGSFQACRTLDRCKQKDLLQPGNPHHIHLSNGLRFLPSRHANLQIPGTDLILTAWKNYFYKI